MVNLLYAAMVLFVATYKKQTDIKKEEWSRPLEVIDSSKVLMEEGDILVRSGNDLISMTLARFNTIDKTYSHCGILLKDSIGNWVVVHSIGGEDNPDQKLKKEDLDSWLAPEHIEGFGVVRYDLSGEQLSQLKKQIGLQYRLPVRFDMDFDLSTDERLYCSEFIYKTLMKVIQEPSLFQVDTVYDRSIIGIDRLFLNSKARFICKVRF